MGYYKWSILCVVRNEKDRLKRLPPASTVSSSVAFAACDASNHPGLSIVRLASARSRITNRRWM